MQEGKHEALAYQINENGEEIPSIKGEASISNQKQRRRTRNDLNDRNFTCGCGKKYLSYPALYTHLKQKHEGKPPNGTCLPKTQGKGTRGRPPKKEDSYKGDSRDEELTGEEFQSLDELLFFLNSISKGNKKQTHSLLKETSSVKEQSSEKRDPLTLLETETLPGGFFEGQEDIREAVEKLIKEPNSLSEDPETGLKFASAEEMIAEFLIRIHKHLTDDCYKEICMLLIAFYNAFSKSLKEISEKEEYLKNQGTKAGNKLLEVSNYFISDFLPAILQNLDTEQYALLGASSDQMKNSVYFIQMFSNWLYTNKFSNSKLDFNFDEV